MCCCGDSGLVANVCCVSGCVCGINRDTVLISHTSPQVTHGFYPADFLLQLIIFDLSCIRLLEPAGTAKQIILALNNYTVLFR